MDGFGLERRWDMKSWLRKDNVYQSIMSGALLIVFLAALSASHWPQLSVVAGLITAVVVSIVAVVYWAAVVCGDDDRTNTERQSDVSVKQEETQREQKPFAGTRREPLQKQEIVEEYVTRYAATLNRLQDAGVATLEQDEFVRRVLLKGMTEEWVASRPDAWLRYSEAGHGLINWLVHQPHHGSHLIVGAGASLKSHRQAYAAARRLASTTAGEDEIGEKVIVTVGSVRIEIQEDDPNKTTTVHITSPETIVTKVAVQEPPGDRPKPEQVSQQRRATTTIH
jgi:hypothetical protein